MSLSKDRSNYDPRLSADAAEFVPRFAVPEGAPLVEGTVYHDPHEQDLSTLQDYLNEILFAMSCDPASFELLAEELLAFLNSVGIPEEQMLHLLVNTIFDFGLAEQNFRYTGARLCNFLSYRMNSSAGDHMFRRLLLQRCQMEYTAFKDTIKTDPEYARNFTLFLAELYAQLSIQSGDSFFRITILAKTIPDILEQLLTLPSPENAKCVAQVFKLCGAFLEDDDLQSNQGKSPSMDRVFRTLTAAVTDQTQPEQSRQLLQDIKNLRAANWGRAAIPAAAAASNSQVATYDSSLIPSFTLTAEEEEFLASQNLFASRVQKDSSHDDTGIDAEIEAEFEKFLADVDS